MSATSLSGFTQLVALSRYLRYWALVICQQNTRTTTWRPHVRIILWLCCSFLFTILAFTDLRKFTNLPLSSKMRVNSTGFMPSESKKKNPFLLRMRAVQWRCTPPPSLVLSNTQQALCPLGRNRSSVYFPFTLSKST